MSDARARRRKAALALLAVLAVGAGGLALWLRSRTGGAIPSAGQGGGGGEEEATAALREGEGRVLASNPLVRDVPAAAAETLPVAASTDREPRVELPTWKDVRLVLVDAVTGLPLDGSAVKSPPSLGIGEWNSRSAPAIHAQLRIEPAPGYVAEEARTFDLEPPLGVVGVSLIYPLHRAIELEVTILDAANRPVPDVEVSEVWSRNQIPATTSESAGPGRVLLRRLPYSPDRVLIVRVAPPASGGEAPGRTLQGGVSSPETFPVRMPATYAPRFHVTHHLVPDPPREHASALGREATGTRAPPRVSDVRVRVRRRDGSPAAGARVWFQGSRVRLCDGQGAATLQALDVGMRFVSLADPRLVPITVPVEVRVNETTEVELIEPDPAMLDVTVLDTDGKAVPVARVEVETPSGMPALDLVDGVLRLDPYTDGIGRRTFTRVEPGAVTVRAWGRGGTGETQVALRPGLRAAVTVVVK